MNSQGLGGASSQHLSTRLPFALSLSRLCGTLSLHLSLWPRLLSHLYTTHTPVYTHRLGPGYIYTHTTFPFLHFFRYLLPLSVCTHHTDNTTTLPLQASGGTFSCLSAASASLSLLFSLGDLFPSQEGQLPQEAGISHLGGGPISEGGGTLRGRTPMEVVHLPLYHFVGGDSHTLVKEIAYCHL